MLTERLRPRAPVHRAPPIRPFAALARLAPPRLALLGLGTVAQTFALARWMAAAGAPSASVALSTAGLFALAVAAQVTAIIVPAPLAAPSVQTPRGRAYALFVAPLLLIALALGALVTLWTAGDLVLHSAQDPGIYVSDAAAFNHYDAGLVLSGRDPYTADAAYWDALRRFPASAATPLRRGHYAASVWGPPESQLRADVARAVANPAARGPEFAPASLHSYPALAFLAYVPAVWAGLGSTLLVSLLALALFFAAIGRQLPARHRLVGWALLVANTLGVVLTLRGSFEALALLPVLLAWQTLPRRWVSPLLLGLACAVKQIAWPLVPLYLVVVARRDGWRAAAPRAPIILGAFILPNLPFALTAPTAWARSLLLPMTLPLFPDGVGLVALARGGLLPLWPPAVYGLLELLALASLAAWLAWRQPAPRPELALALGLLPLAFAWRSLVAYFVLIPALTLYAAIPLLVRDDNTLARALGSPVAPTLRETQQPGVDTPPFHGRPLGVEGLKPAPGGRG